MKMRSESVYERTVERYVPAILFFFVFGVYLNTTAPTVYLGDSGEFTAAAYSLGIPHNSGYPLYSLIGKIFCMIPLGNVGFRMNLMSVFFASLAVLLVYGIILRLTRSPLCSLSAAGFLAFTPLFWFQTVSAEVYPLHCFFLALMIRLLWEWDEKREFFFMVLFVFVTGLSFANHMQTVMLALPVLYFVISKDRKAVFTIRHFAALSIFFLLPLTLYVYLPIRTQAGAAIHWGDPDSLDRFLAHVTAASHRNAYVFSAEYAEYIWRFLEGLRVLFRQYGILLVLSLWGWIRLPSVRWKVFFAGVIVFDLFYTVFLNIISLEITPFTLPSSILLTILLGVGLKGVVQWAQQEKRIGMGVRRGLKVALCMLPLIPLAANFSACDQGSNYTAYEHAVNIFRTVDRGDTIFLDGDNNVFPVAYGRIVEGMGQGIALYDRHNVIFKWRLPHYPFIFEGSWKDLESAVINMIITSSASGDVYFAVMNPFGLSLPKGYRIQPFGILLRVVRADSKGDFPTKIWDYYYTKSWYDQFHRDYMNREVICRNFFRLGQDLYQRGATKEGMRALKLSSMVGYDDTSIHSDLGVFFADHGRFNMAYRELEKALDFNDDLGGVFNNWGYYYHKKGDYEKAVPFFRKAIQLKPDNFSYYNNLGFTLNRMGDTEAAAAVFRKSLLIKPHQPDLIEFMRRHKIPHGPDERPSP